MDSEGDRVSSCLGETISDLSVLQDSPGELRTSSTSFRRYGSPARSVGILTIPQISLSNDRKPNHVSSTNGSATALATSAHSSVFDSDQQLDSQRSDMETQYVIVEDPMDLNSFGDFSSLHIAPCTSYVLGDTTETHIPNTPQVIGNEESSKGAQFDSVEMLVAQNACEETKLSDKTISETLTTFSFQDSELTDENTESDYTSRYVYQLDSIVSHKEPDVQTVNSYNENESSVKKSDESGATLESAQKNEKPLTNVDCLNEAKLNIDPNDIVPESEASECQASINGDNNNAQDTSSKTEPIGDSQLSDEYDSAKLKEKSEQEKTTFSENLGLIPAFSELMKTNQRLENASKGVRTRKSCEKARKNSSEKSSASIIPGHNHETDFYKCGSCGKTFEIICSLHDHLFEHNAEGSYCYDHSLRTAFPNFDFSCTNTQVEENAGRKGKKKRPAFKRPSKPVLTKKMQTKVDKPNASNDGAPVKRKRGRPPKHSKEINTLIKTERLSNLETKDATVDENSDQLDYSTAEFTDMVKTNNGHETASPTLIEYVNDECTDDQTYLDVREALNCNTSNNNKPENDSPPKRKRKMSFPRKVLLVDSTLKKRKYPRRKDVKLNCEFCHCVLQNTAGLIRHEQEQHADKMKLKCDVCDMKFMREYLLERHKLCVHSEGKTGDMSDRKGIYREKRKGGKKDKTLGSTVCDFCNKPVPNDKLDVHLRIHTGERPFICEVCGKGLISDKKLKRHMLIHSVTKRHTCEVCGLGFSMMSKLRTHMYIHTGHKPYLCSVCGAEFNNSTSMLHHHRTVHLGDKRFECKICGGKYGKKSQLEEHMFSHSNERTQTCRFCGKSFKHAKSLRRHELTHVTETKFACDQCDSKFSRKDNLERHKMCHLEAALQCCFCKKKFRDREPLLEHERYHIKSRRYQCQICRDRFQDETYFYNHMEKNHGINKDMVPMVTALALNSPEKSTKSKRSSSDSQSVLVEGLKIPDIVSSGTTTIDTLNLSMSVAGIIPTTSGSSDPGTQNIPNIQTVLNAQSNVVLSPDYTNGQITDNPGNSSFLRNAPTSQTNPNFAVSQTGAIFQAIPDLQRVAIINQSETGMQREETVVPIALVPTENVVLHEQHRLMQEAIGTNVQNSTFKLENIY